MVDTIPDLAIYKSDSDEPLSEDNVVPISSSDYLICRSKDGSISDPPLIYTWYKTSDTKGPNVVRSDNQNDGSNR